MKHLYVQTAFLGDLLLSIPALKNLRRWDPKSEITLMCRKGLGSIILNMGLCDEVLEVDKRDQKSLDETDRKLQESTFDYIFSPHQSFRSHKYVNKTKAQHKIGYKKIWNASFFTKRVKRNLQWPEVLRQLQLLALVDDGLKDKLNRYEFNYSHRIEIPDWAKMSIPHLSWPLNEYEQLEKKWGNHLNFNDPYVCIAPGSVWPTKRWTESGFVNASIKLVREGYRIIILGAPDERALCEKIQRQIPNSISLAGGLSIWQSMMVLKRSQGIICNDSGAMHMAAVVDVPIISLFGPTVQELGYRPWSSKSIVLENTKMLCRPCGQHGGKRCPIGTHDCMKSLSAEQVVESFNSIL